MGYREHDAPEGLRREVACLWTVEGDGGAARVLPDGCVDVLFDLEAGAARIIGAMTAAIVTDGGARRLLGVRFRPGEAPAFLGLPAVELTDRAVPIDAITASTVAGQVAGAPTLSSRSEAVGRFLRELRGARGADPRVRNAVLLLERGRPVSDAAAEVGVGERQLERLFLERVGVGPKRFARAARLQRLVRAFGASRPDWARLAFSLGYADQAHLVREVRALAGVTPGALWRELAGMSETSNATPAAGVTPAVIGRDA